MGKMNGRKMMSLSKKSSKTANDGGGISVGSMHPLDSPANTKAPERPLLEEGFYELEEIRKKRIRQGKVEYLIKWQGWPESSNTWEPHENLSSCPDVIAAFERRSPSRTRSGKQSTRGCKRKFSATPETSAVAAEDDVPLVVVPFDDPSIHNHVNNNDSSRKNSPSSGGMNRRVFVTKDSSLEKAVIDSEDTKIPTRFSKSFRPGPRRVIRNKDSSADAPDPIRRTTCEVGNDEFENVELTEIIRPLKYCLGVPNTFGAKRSDGKTVIVDNDFLKENTPLLLIKFYEENMSIAPSI